MFSTAPCSAPPPAHALAHLRRRCASWLRRAWAGACVDPDEPWLAQATDHADLERRLKRLERGRPDRFAPLPR